MRICQLDETHISQVVELFIEVFEQEPWNEIWQAQWVEDRCRCILDSKYSMGFVVEQDDKVVGAVFGRGVPFKGQLDFEIAEFFVSPAKQRAGIGAALLHHLNESLIAGGYGSSVLLTAVDSVASKFYKQHGYEENCDLRFMLKKLL